MKIVTMKMLAKRTGKSVGEVRERLRYGWTTELLAKAGGVTANYVGKVLRRGKLSGIRVGRDWLVSREDGDGWLADRGVSVG